MLKQSLEDQFATQQGFGESEGGRDGIHDVAGCWKADLRRLLGGFSEELMELAGAMVTGGLRSRYILEVHWSAELMGGVVLVDTAGPTLRSGQEPHTPGGTEVTSVDVGSGDTVDFGSG